MGDSPAEGNVVYVGFWRRFAAFLLDLVFLGVPTTAISYSFTVIGLDVLQYIMSLVYVGVIIYMEGALGGTPAKLVLGYRIVNEDYELIGVENAFLRYVGRIIVGFTLFIGYVMIGFSERKQGLHDRIASTYVIET